MTRAPIRVLIVDDHVIVREGVRAVLEDEGFSTRTAANSSEALQALVDRRPSLALLDVWLQGSKLDGLQLLEEMKKRDPTLPQPDPRKTAVFAILQKYVRVNLVRPVGATHMWHAAMQSKACKLTVLGEHYRKLVEAGRI